MVEIECKKEKTKMRDLLHFLKLLLIRVTNFIVGFLPRDKNLILFTAWFGEKYIDGSKYLYEFFILHSQKHVVWYTRNKELYKKLLSENKPVVYSRSLMGVIMEAKASVLVSTVQLADYSPYFLKGSIYFDLGHGFPIKQSGFEQPDTTEKYKEYVLLLRKFIKYYMCVSSNWTGNITKRAFQLNHEQLIICPNPRTDVLYDSMLRNGVNTNIDKIKSGRKAIVYMPTHRSMGNIRMDMEKLLDLDAIEDICERNNCVFLIKKHFYHRNEHEDFKRYEFIFDITNDDIDPEVLTYQADVLITDYSAAYIDYLLLDRPIVFFTYDYEYFVASERNLYLDFDQIDAGYRISDKNELTNVLMEITEECKDDLHSDGRKRMKDLYFCNAGLGKARKTLCEIIGNMQ